MRFQPKCMWQDKMFTTNRHWTGHRVRLSSTESFRPRVTRPGETAQPRYPRLRELIKILALNKVPPALFQERCKCHLKKA